MKESKAYQEILAEGESSGFLNGERRAILVLIEGRFGKKAASTFQRVLNVIDDSSQLEQLMFIAARCDKMQELRDATLSMS